MCIIFSLFIKKVAFKFFLQALKVSSYLIQERKLGIYVWFDVFLLLCVTEMFRTVYKMFVCIE